MVLLSRYFAYGSAAFVGAVACYYAFRKYSMTQSVKLLQDTSVKHSLKIVSKENVSHDTIILRVALPTSNHTLGLPVGKCIRLSAQINSEEVARPYTPVTLVDTKGYFDLLVKVYRSNSDFPNGGKFSQYLEGCKVGDYLSICGPFGKIEYNGNGKFTRAGSTQKYSHVLMVAGGSGITPMLQIIANSLADDSDQTVFSLIFANKSVNDILLKEELDELARKHPKRLSVLYTVNQAPADSAYDGQVGYVTEDILGMAKISPANNPLVMLCGPRPMIQFVTPKLTNMGFADASVFSF